MPEFNTLTTALTLSALKDIVPVDGMIVLLLGKNAVYDNMGGFYRWDVASTAVEDTQYMKQFTSTTVTGAGRWVRVFQNVRPYPQGLMVIVGGVKTLYGSSTTVADGTSQLFLTAENTANGTSLFTEIWSARSEAGVDSATITGLVNSGRKTMDLKQVTHFFYRPNPVTITLGLVYSPFAAVPAGMAVSFVVQGI